MYATNNLLFKAFKPKPKSNVACPLDTLLKGNRREEAAKTHVEGKCDTKVWAAETGRGDDRMRARRSFSNTPGEKSEEPLMSDEAGKALLGKEDAGAVGVTLEEDRRKEEVLEVVMVIGFTFWSGIESEIVDNHLITFLPMKSIGFLDEKALSASESSFNYPPNPLLRDWILDIPFSVTFPLWLA
ncbi:hypothetical protein BU17DRAFT_68349 [Hysterangium stoloniferum]|nr:hypothetical protein BU17DRAFT_68349 [Hysterangium stoloniferum]